MFNEFLKKWGLLSFVMLLTMAIVVGCSTEEVQQETTQDGEVSNEEITNEKAASEEESENEGSDMQQFPITFTDATGQEVTIENEPQTIISLLPSNTEIVFALGLGDRVVGVTAYCNYPAEVLEIEKVGAQEINVELILTLLPDLALVNQYHFQNYSETLNQFEDAGIDVVVIDDASTFTDVYQTIELIASATGTTEIAEEMIVDMKDRLKIIEEKAKSVTDKKTVWVEVSPAPDIFTTGQGTFVHEILESIQAINAAGEHKGWVKLTEEEMVQLNPDVIITTYGYYVENPRSDVLARDGWAEVLAIKNEQVFDVNNDTVTRPGPRLIEGVEMLAKLIYPEIFE